MLRTGRFYVADGGKVFRILSKKAIEKLWFGEEALSPVDCVDLFFIDEQDRISSLCFADEIVEGRTFLIYVGSISEFMQESSEMFDTLEQLAEYYRKKGKMPWGLKIIMRRLHWKAIPVSGCSLAIRDESNRKTMYVYGKTKEVYIESD